MIFLSYVCVCGAKADIRQNKPGGIKKIHSHTLKQMEGKRYLLV